VLVLRRVWPHQKSTHGLRFFTTPSNLIFLHLNYRPTHPLLDSAAPAARIHLLPGLSSSRGGAISTEGTLFTPTSLVAHQQSSTTSSPLLSSSRSSLCRITTKHPASTFWICDHHHPKGKKASTLFLVRCFIHPPVFYIPGLAARLPDATIIFLAWLLASQMQP
jgi:hypothetical protein